eukprot:TRINITY_DN3600_c1_g2_i1.p1 TRINITY_DN3600_c1_g2~~TRINITY_DN3600_c1_g2_i1.p1  ORF type:complete len:299 (+),score=88.06 TRINITY_DN3600_c1_g2_i1:112-897(+)
MRKRSTSSNAFGDHKFYASFKHKCELEDMKKQSKHLKNELRSKDNEIKILKQSGAVETSSVSYDDLKQQMQDIQLRLYSDDCSPAEMETLNIEYERLEKILEKMPEFLAAKEKEEEAWSIQNHEENESAHRLIFWNLENTPTSEKEKRFRQAPALKLVTYNPEKILKLHDNDWTTFVSHGLNLLEARAVFFSLPKFRKDQTKQLQFMESVKNKIEDLKNQTFVAKPIVAKKQVKLQRPQTSTTSSEGGFLEELVQRRKKFN